MVSLLETPLEPFMVVTTPIDYCRQKIEDLAWEIVAFQAAYEIPRRVGDRDTAADKQILKTLCFHYPKLRSWWGNIVGWHMGPIPINPAARREGASFSTKSWVFLKTIGLETSLETVNPSDQRSRKMINLLRQELEIVSRVADLV